MKAAVAAVALALIVGGCYASAQVRKQAANDFGCPQDEIVVHQLNAGYIARGCKKLWRLHRPASNIHLTRKICA